VARNIKGYPDNCIPLPPDADDEELAALCRAHTAKLHAWLAERGDVVVAVAEAPPGDDGKVALPRYDGSVLSACRIYQMHPMSRFHTVKQNTRKTYVDSLKVIEQSVGARQIRRLNVLDVMNWYDQWKKPVVTVNDKGETMVGRERIDRAHDAVSMFRTVLRFCTALRFPECKQLAEELSAVKFEKGGAREQEMTYAQVGVFIRKALAMGKAGTIPQDRALYMAIGTAAQFELLLRQKDIIGERGPAKPGVRNAVYYDDWMWTGYFTWENIPGWRWRMKTSKSKYRAAAEFDLSRYDMLLPLLEAVPHEQRAGPIVKDETGRPVREGSYRRWFRQIARAAGIPDEVWNMDTRAGGATEAEESGAALEAIQSALTHSKAQTTLRYIRKRSTKIATVAEARKLKRGTENGGGD
jgi:hypothetical protein